MERIEQNILYVSGVDFITGTPVLDIKPYVPLSDSIPNATSSWTKDRSNQILKVSLSPLALSQIYEQIGHAEIHDQKVAGFIQLITEVIELDPRAHPYKGDAINPQPYGKSYGMNLEGFNVTFTVEGETATVDSVESGFNKGSSKV